MNMQHVGLGVVGFLLGYYLAAHWKKTGSAA